LLEEMVYDEQGQLLTGTLADYLVPGAVEMPDITIAHLQTPSPLNPLGAKGVGEGGAVPAPAALAAAVEDALHQFGAEIAQIPITPSRVIGLIAAAQKQLNSD
jgi:CO/xanthine dehydrogenase Mo-binding subunit